MFAAESVQGPQDEGAEVTLQTRRGDLPLVWGDGQAEIKEAQGAIGTDHDVSWFEIAMHDALLMDVGQDLAETDDER